MEQVQALSWHRRAACGSLEVLLCDGEPRWDPCGDSGPPAGHDTGSRVCDRGPGTPLRHVLLVGTWRALLLSLSSKLLVCEVMKTVESLRRPIHELSRACRTRAARGKGSVLFKDSRHHGVLLHTVLAETSSQVDVWESKAQTRGICTGKQKCVSARKEKERRGDRIRNFQGGMRLNRGGIRRQQA